MLTLPFRQAPQEVLLSAAATLLLNRLHSAGAPEYSIADLCEEPQYGYTASASAVPDGPRFIRISDLQRGSVDWSTVPYCNEPPSRAYDLAVGDILIARSGSVGKSFGVTAVPERSVFASYLIRLRTHPDVSPRYIYWCLQSQQFWSQLLNKSRGSAMKNVNGRMLQVLRFVLPNSALQESVSIFLDGFRRRLAGQNEDLPELLSPLEGQRQVVARTERLAEHIHSALALREEAIGERKAVLTSFVSHIDAGQRRHCALVPLSYYVRRERGAARSGPFGSALLHSEFVSDGVPAIGIQDVQAHRFILTRKWNVTPAKAEELKRYTVRPRDLLVTVMGTLGRACVVPDDVPPMVSTKHVWTISLDCERTNPHWISLWLNFSRLVRNDLLGQGTGTAIAGLNGEKILSVPLPLVPLGQQNSLVSDVHALQTSLGAMMALHEESSVELDALLPSILDRAFKGEL
jgi:type I restriction enzyme S subunit